MTTQTIAYYREQCRRMGRWMAPRYLRNRGVPFEQAYFVIFGQPPRRNLKGTQA